MITLPTVLIADPNYMPLLRLCTREFTPSQREDVETLIALAYMRGAAEGMRLSAETMRPTETMQ